MTILTNFLIILIKIYKFLISPLFGESCRYFPSCSEYSVQSLKAHGLFKGLILSLKRILSCHPWSRGGFDPVKKEIKVKK
tara:strand:- start:71 stop:310 length:240 start_codon:yes stop_codon:yes gene_type:complete